MNPIGRRHDNRSLKVFVGALPGDAPEWEVRAYFSRFGIVRDVVMFYKQDQIEENRRINRGYCHVLMDSPASVSKILSRKEHHFYGRTIVCSRYLKGSELKRKNQKHDNTRIMIKYFPPYVTAVQLKEFMRTFGHIVLAYFISPHPEIAYPLGSNYQTASVQFTSEESVERLLSECPLYFDSFRLKVEPYVYKQQRISPEWEDVIGTPIEFQIQRNNLYFSSQNRMNTNYPEQNQVLNINQVTLSGEQAAPEARRRQDRDQRSAWSHVKPTSYQFSHALIHHNHFTPNNLLYRLLKKTLSNEEEISYKASIYFLKKKKDISQQTPPPN